MDELVTCEYCGNVWDGNAQCNCYESMIDIESDEETSSEWTKQTDNGKVETLKVEQLQTFQKQDDNRKCKEFSVTVNREGVISQSTGVACQNSNGDYKPGELIIKFKEQLICLIRCVLFLSKIMILIVKNIHLRYLLHFRTFKYIDHKYMKIMVQLS